MTDTRDKKFGKDSTYRILHMWVDKNLGKPNVCEMCGTHDSGLRYDWANVSQKYERDIWDWRRLCRGCHRREKNPGRCKYDHKMTESNTYKYPSSNRTECIICRKRLKQVFIEKRRNLRVIV